MARVLIVDDDEAICKVLSDMIAGLGHEVSVGHTLRECLEELEIRPPDVVFLDVRLPDGNSLEVLPKIREAVSSPTIIVMTAYGDSKGAEIAIRHEVWDYIPKPSSVRELTLPLLRALQHREERRASATEIEINRDGIVGNSLKIRSCLNMVKQAAGSDVNVLITGETGTGKELFAWSIHRNSKRSGNNFVVVDCTALPETLVESILFGHVKGAFTGADKAQEGLVRQAHHGTLFLDEMGELPLSLQKTFLRVLQEHRFRPLGSQKEVESNFRLISATNKNLEQMVQRGRFRGDLLYRLGAMTIQLPPLRSYPEDIKELSTFYIKKICNRFGIETKKLSDDFLKHLAMYEWPGNVRELAHTLERACAAALHEATLYPLHLPQELRVNIKTSLLSRGQDPPGGGSELKEQIPDETPRSAEPSKELVLPSLKKFRNERYSALEEEYLRNLVTMSSKSVKEACAISGLSRTRLYGLLKKYRIRAPRSFD